jgi:hypothetical protein
MQKNQQRLIDRSAPEDVCARVPEVAAQPDPVLDDDALSQGVRADLGKRDTWTLVHGRQATLVEVILRLLLCTPLSQ